MHPLLESFNNELNKLTEKNKQLEEELKRKNELLDCYRDTAKEYYELSRSITVSKIFHHKQRGNTTIVFNDSSSVTVHLRKGDKNCLETAIAWALTKHTYNMKELLKYVQEVGE